MVFYVAIIVKNSGNVLFSPAKVFLSERSEVSNMSYRSRFRRKQSYSSDIIVGILACTFNEVKSQKAKESCIFGEWMSLSC